MKDSALKLREQLRKTLNIDLWPTHASIHTQTHRYTYVNHTYLYIKAKTLLIQNVNNLRFLFLKNYPNLQCRSYWVTSQAQDSCGTFYVLRGSFYKWLRNFGYFEVELSSHFYHCLNTFSMSLAHLLLKAFVFTSNEAFVFPVFRENFLSHVFDEETSLWEKSLCLKTIGPGNNRENHIQFHYIHIYSKHIGHSSISKYRHLHNSICDSNSNWNDRYFYIPLCTRKCTFWSLQLHKCTSY